MPTPFISLLSNRIFGGQAPGADGTFTPQQTQAGNRAWMQTAAALLASSQDPFTTFGGALGKGLAAGQAGYDNALNQDAQRAALAARTGYVNAQTGSTKATTAAALAKAQTLQRLIGGVYGPGAATQPPTLPALANANQRTLVVPQSSPAVIPQPVPGVDITSNQTPPMVSRPMPPAPALNEQQRTITAPGLPARPQAMPNRERAMELSAKLAQAGYPVLAKQYADIAQVGVQKPTTLEQNAQAAGFTRGTPEYQQFLRDQLSSPGQTINVNSGLSLPPAEAKATAAFGTGIGTRANDRVSAAQEALAQNTQLGQLQTALATGVQTGLGQEQLLGLHNLAQSLFGIQIDPNIGQQELIQTIGNQMALRLRNPASGLGLTGSTSNKDLTFLRSSVPGLQRTPQGNAAIIDALQRINRMKVDAARYQAQLIQQHGGVVPADLDSRMLEFVNGYQLYSPEEREQVKKVAEPANNPPAGGNARFAGMPTDQLRQAATGDLSGYSPAELSALAAELQRRGL